MLKQPYFYTMGEKVKGNVKSTPNKVSEKRRKVLSSKRMLSIVGGNIRAVRKSQRITIGKLAEMAHISEKYLQGVEVGKRNISITNLYKISSTLKVSLDSFFIENRDDTTERILLIEARLKDYNKDQLKYVETLIEHIKSILDRSNIDEDQLLPFNDDFVDTDTLKKMDNQFIRDDRFQRPLH